MMQASNGTIKVYVNNIFGLKRAVKFVAIMTVSLLFGGCSKHYTVDKLVGTYELRTDQGMDVIKLNRNGTYTHSFTAKGGTTNQLGGNWDLAKLDAGPTVTLSDFKPLPGEVTDGQGYYLLEVETFSGSIILVTNLDLNQGYKKQL